MGHAELAKKIRQAIFDRADQEGGAISREEMDDSIEKVLAAASAPNPRPHPLAPIPAAPRIQQEEWR